MLFYLETSKTMCFRLEISKILEFPSGDIKKPRFSNVETLKNQVFPLGDPKKPCFFDGLKAGGKGRGAGD